MLDEETMGFLAEPDQDPGLNVQNMHAAEDQAEWDEQRYCKYTVVSQVASTSNTLSLEHYRIVAWNNHLYFINYRPPLIRYNQNYPVISTFP
jgi:hypothetical protein